MSNTEGDEPEEDTTNEEGGGSGHSHRHTQTGLL